MSGIAASLGSLKLLKAGRTPGHPDVRTPARMDVQAPEQPDVQAAAQPGVRTPGRMDSRTPARTDVRVAALNLPLQGTGKRSHPDFRKRTVLLRDSTWKRAARKWQDEGSGDFSELVEKLLQDYAGEGR